VAFQFPVAKEFFNPEPTRKAFEAASGFESRRPMPLLEQIQGAALLSDFFVCRALIGRTWHEYCLRETVASANNRLVNDLHRDYRLGFG